MITQKVYDLILEEYGSRRCWISDLAAKLGICYANANYLTYAMGFCRGRATVVTAYSVFANDPTVQAICNTTII